MTDLAPVERPTGRGPLTPGRPAKGHDRIHIDLRRAEVERLELDGWSQRRIAASVGVSREVVRDDLAAIRRARHEWFGVADLEQLRVLEYQRLEALRADIQADIEESLVVFVKVDADGQPIDGEPALLQMAADSRDHRLKSRRLLLQTSARVSGLLGLDAPVKLEHSGRISTDIPDDLVAAILADAAASGIDLATPDAIDTTSTEPT